MLGPLGFYRRSVFVIDGGGIVRYVHRGPGRRHVPAHPEAGRTAIRAATAATR